MASRQYARQDFVAKVDGKEYRFKGYTTDTRNGGCETIVSLDYPCADSKYSWCGRPWQRFDYETALRRTIEKFPKSMRAALTRQLIDRVAAEEEEKAEKSFNEFKAIHDKCSPRQKEMLAKSGIVMHNEDDMNAVKGLMLLGQLMGI